MYIKAGFEPNTIHKSNTYGKFKILGYASSKVAIKFLSTGYIRHVSISAASGGRVKDPYMPKVCGVGYMGAGQFKARVNKQQTKAYVCWNSMIQRCYSEKLHARRPDYSDCEVHDSWKNYQNFAKWHYENTPTDKGNYQLDKDIIIEGNRIYSPETCLMVTPQENVEKGHAKEYVFKSPLGETVNIYNLEKFCRENELIASCMSSVYSGKRSHHKGWERR